MHWYYNFSLVFVFTGNYKGIFFTKRRKTVLISVCKGKQRCI